MFPISQQKSENPWSNSNDDDGVWFSNTIAVFGLLLALVVFHILLLSYMEARWLARANAIRRRRMQRREEGEASFRGARVKPYLSTGKIDFTSSWEIYGSVWRTQATSATPLRL